MLITDIELMKNLGNKVIQEEWVYFQEQARKYIDNEPKKRYGILPMGAALRLENIIYAEGTLKLRRKHLQYISENGMSEGHKVRKHLDWLEKLEGKQ